MFMNAAVLRQKETIMKKIISSISAAALVTAVAAMNVMYAFAEDATEAAEKSSGNAVSAGDMFKSMFLPLIVMFALLYLFAIRPQKKREKEQKEMQQSLEVGDEIVTNAGIVGIVIKTGEDTVVIETGGEKSKMRIKTWAITENVSAMERFKAAKAAAANKKAEKAGIASAELTDDEDENKKSKKNKKKDDEE